MPLPFVLRPYRRFPVQCSGDLPMRPGETLSLAVRLSNEQRIEIPEAVVRWSRGQAFAVENVAIKLHTRARLQHYVKRLVQRPVEIIL